MTKPEELKLLTQQLCLIFSGSMGGGAEACSSPMDDDVIERIIQATRSMFHLTPPRGGWGVVGPLTFTSPEWAAEELYPEVKPLLA